MSVAPAVLAWAEVAATIDRLNRTDPRAALDVASGWLGQERDSVGSEGYTRALRAHAHALRSTGQYDAAIAEYEEAEARFRRLGLEAEAARTEIGHVTALRYKGRYEEGMELALRTRAYFLARGDELQAAKVSLNLGTLYRPMGRLTDALAAYQDARRVFRRLRDDLLTAMVEQNIGNVLVDLGRYHQALQHLRAAERMRRRLGHQADLAQTLMNIGILSRQRGDYGYALVMLSEAGRIDQELGDERSARLVDLELLPTCLALNLHEESGAVAERAITGMRRFKMPFELGQALLAAAGRAEIDGDLEHAARYIDEAQDIFGKLGNRVWEAMARLRRAGLMLRATGQQSDLDDPFGDTAIDSAESVAVDDGGDASADHDADESLDETVEVDRLRHALAECHDVTRAFQAAGALDLAASGWLLEAAILGRLADLGEAEPDQALDRYRDVLTAATALNADHLLYQAHAALGTLLQTTDPDAAIDSFRAAIDHLEAVRARARADDLKLSFLSDKTSLYERVVGLLVEREDAVSLAEAYSYVERSKSRTLLEDLLGGSGAPRGGQRSHVNRLAQKVRDLRARLNSYYVQAYNGGGVPTSERMAGSTQSDTIAALEAELTRALRDLQLAARAEQGNGELTAADDTVPPLPAGTALIELYAVGEDLLAFVVTADGLHLRRIASVDKVARQAERLSFQIGSMTASAEYVAENLDKLRTTIDRNFQQLYKAIVAPLENVLDGHERLVVVPHGPLHGLPFHAFHDGTGYLAERFTIAYAPSAGVYQAGLRTARAIGDRMMAVGIDDPGLPWVGYEVDEVVAAWPGATALRGAAASGRGLRRQVGRFDALHLATHGVFRADNPAFSSIKLADCWLTVNDLAEVARGAQLVTLSACESGVTGLSVGDEVIGLTRGLLSAGCSTIVASLWTVSDESTAHLMADFYRQLQAGAEPAAALQAAMLGLRPRYDHPYYWAAFAVIGGGLGRAS